MPLREILSQTIAALWDNKLRSVLTMFGIVWGITSVILLVGLGIGFNIQQHEQLQTIGVDIAILFGGKTGMPSGGYAAGRDVRMTIDDVNAIKREASLVKNVSPELRRTVSEVSPWNAAARAVRGVWPEYQQFRSLMMVQGFPYIVIGVLEKKKQNGSYGSGPDNTQLFVPYSAMARDFPPAERPGVFPGWVNNIVVQPRSPDVHEQALAQVTRILAERHHFDPADKDAMWVWDTLEGAKFTERIFSVMTLFFAVVALLTLALGGIGVMNIMLVAVTERTREIGVRKALGATAVDIRRQFLAESAIITLVSGTAGLTLGVGICLLLRLLPRPDFLPLPAISPLAILASLFTLGLITVSAGTYPALRAASLTPIECLHVD